MLARAATAGPADRELQRLGEAVLERLDELLSGPDEPPCLLHGDLWRGNVRLNASMSDGELYTYSIVWLLMAVTLLLGGAWRWGDTVYKAGLALLCVVIAKLFLVDMAGLTGLLRVASFMGMGLALLAIGYLHQHLQRKGTTAS